MAKSKTARIVVNKEREPMVVSLDLSDAEASDIAVIARCLAINLTRLPEESSIILALVWSEGEIFFTSRGQEIFPGLQPPVAPETLTTLANSWLAKIA